MENPKRKISAGTVVMLFTSLLVLCAAAYVLIRLSSGSRVDLTRLRSGAVVEIDTQDRSSAETAEREPQAATQTAAPAAVPEIPPAAEQAGKSITLTFGGTVNMAGEVRTNSY